MAESLCSKDEEFESREQETYIELEPKKKQVEELLNIVKEETLELENARSQISELTVEQERVSMQSNALQPSQDLQTLENERENWTQREESEESEELNWTDTTCEIRQELACFRKENTNLKIERLEQNLNEECLQAEIATMKAEVEISKRSVESLSDLKFDTDEQLWSLAQEKLAVEKQLEEAKNELQVLTSQPGMGVRGADARDVADLNEKLCQSQFDISELRCQLDCVEGESQIRKLELSKMNKDNKDLVIALQKVQEQNKILESQLQELQINGSQVKESAEKGLSLESIDQEKEMLKKRVAELENELLGLSEFKQMSERNQSMETDIDDVESGAGEEHAAVSGLKFQLCQLQAEKNRLAQENKELNATSQEVQDHNKALEQKFDEFRNETKEVWEELVKLQQVIHTLNDSLDKKKTEIVEKVNEIETLRTDLDELFIKIQQKQREIDTLTEEISKLKKEVKESKSNAGTWEDAVESLNFDLAALEEEKSTLMTRLETSDEKLRELQDELLRVKCHNEKSEEDEKRLEESNSNLLKLKNTIEVLTSDNTELCSKVVTMKELESSLKRDAQNAKEELQKKSSECEDLGLQIAEYRSEITLSAEQSMEIQEKLSTAESKLRDMVSGMKERDENVSALEEERDAAFVSLEAKDKDIANLMKVNEDLTNELESKQEALNEGMKELESSLKRDAQNAKEELQKKTTECEDLSLQIAEYRSEITLSAEQSMEIQEKLSTAESKLRDMVSGMKERDENVSALEEERDAAFVSLEAKDKDIANLMNVNEDLTNELESKQEALNEIETLRTDLDEPFIKIQQKQGEIDTLAEEISKLKEELKESKSNAGTIEDVVQPLSFNLAALEEEKSTLITKLETSEEKLRELQDELLRVKCHNEQSEEDEKRFEESNSHLLKLKNTIEALTSDNRELCSKVDEMKEVESSLERDAQNAKEELQKKTTECEDLGLQIAEYKSEITLSAEQSMEIQEKLSTAESKLRDMVSGNKERDENASGLQEERDAAFVNLEAKDKDIANLMKVNEDLTNELESKQEALNEIETLRTDLDELFIKIQQKQGEIDTLTEEISKLKDELKESKSNAGTMEDAVESLNFDLAALEEEKSTLMTKLVTSDEKLRELQDELLRVKCHNEKSEEDEQRLEESNANLLKLKNTIEALTSDNRELCSKVDEMKELESSLERDAQNGKEELQKKSTECEDLSLQIAEYRSEITLSAEQSMEIQEKLSTAESKLRDMVSGMKERDENVSALQEERDAAFVSLEAKDKDIANLMKVNEDLTNELESKQEAVTLMSDENDILSQKYREENENCEKLKSCNETLLCELKEKDDLCNILEKKNESCGLLKSSNESLTAELKERQAEIDQLLQTQNSMLTQLSEVEMCVAKLKKEIESKDDEIRKLSGNLTMISDQLLQSKSNNRVQQLEKDLMDKETELKEKEDEHNIALSQIVESARTIEKEREELSVMLLEKQSTSLSGESEKEILRKWEQRCKELDSNLTLERRKCQCLIEQVNGLKASSDGGDSHEQIKKLKSELSDMTQDRNLMRDERQKIYQKAKEHKDKADILSCRIRVLTHMLKKEQGKGNDQPSGPVKKLDDKNSGNEKTIPGGDKTAQKGESHHLSRAEDVHKSPSKTSPSVSKPSSGSKLSSPNKAGTMKNEDRNAEKEQMLGDKGDLSHSVHVNSSPTTRKNELAISPRIKKSSPLSLRKKSTKLSDKSTSQCSVSKTNDKAADSVLSTVKSDSHSELQSESCSISPSTLNDTQDTRISHRKRVAATVSQSSATGLKDSIDESVEATSASGQERVRRVTRGASLGKRESTESLPSQIEEKRPKVSYKDPMTSNQTLSEQSEPKTTNQILSEQSEPKTTKKGKVSSTADLPGRATRSKAKETSTTSKAVLNQITNSPSKESQPRPKGFLRQTSKVSERKALARQGKDEAPPDCKNQ